MRYDKFIRFCLVGVVSVALNLLLFYTLVDIFSLNYLVSVVFIFVVVNLFGFIANKYFSFRVYDGCIILQSVKYYIVMFVSLLVNMMLMFFLVDILSIWYIHASLLTSFFMALLNFFAHSGLTFGRD